MKQFRNKGWRYLEQMEDILPQGGTTGALSYRGTISVSAIRGESQQVASESADSPTSITGGLVVSNALAVAFASGSTTAVNTSPSTLFVTISLFSFLFLHHLSADSLLIISHCSSRTPST